MNAPFSDPLPVTLSTLALASRWVAWQTEEREPGKPLTKVPYDPSSQRKALANDPTTWGTRPSAETRAARLPKPFGAGGVGIELGDLGDGRCLGGVDLDTCRDEDGTLAPWAMEIVDWLNSYTEISPSRSGAKVFFTYAQADRLALRAAMGTDHGRTWKRPGSGEHPPAIELHIGNRYFAVTDEQLAGTPNELRPIALDMLLWLIREAGPAFVGTGQAQAKGDGRYDNSRSAIAFRKGSALRAEGATFEQMCAALRADPETRDWVAEKGDASGGRELRRIWEARDGQVAADGLVDHPTGGGRDRKRPLFRAMPRVPDFPIMALDALRPAAEAIHETTRAPMAVCAQSVLAATTLAAQAHWDVELPGAGRRPLTALFVSVLESGERKSTVDRLAVRAAYEVEASFRDASQAAVAAHMDDKETWEHTRSQAKLKYKRDRAGLAEAFREIGPAPRPPAHPMLLVADPTPEGLVLHLAARPWGGLFTAEGGLFLGGSAMNDETRLRMGALLNTLWDGDPIRRLRVGTGAAYLPGRRCSVHIMVQPSIASRFFADAILAGIGTLARTLLVAPMGTAGTRLFRDPPSSAGVVLADYDARLAAMMAKPPRTAGDDPTVLDPVSLRLHPDAREMWIAFHDAVELAQKVEGPLHPIRTFASKMAEHAGRLAAVLTIYANPAALDVTAEAMAGGIELAQHYAAELLRLQGAAGVSLDLDLAARLLEWWQARPDPRCYLALIYQRGLNAISDAATARKIVHILEDHGWVDRLPAGTELDDAPRQEAWELVP